MMSYSVSQSTLLWSPFLPRVLGAQAYMVKVRAVFEGVEPIADDVNHTVMRHAADVV
jgi:hypothetical protein